MNVPGAFLQARDDYKQTRQAARDLLPPDERAMLDDDNRGAIMLGRLMLAGMAGTFCGIAIAIVGTICGL